MNYSGFVIRRERLKRNFSQEGLCNGICAVSYLSKIEHGKAEVSDEIVLALFKKLGINWYCSEADIALGRELSESGYEALFSYDMGALKEVVSQVDNEGERLTNGKFAPDFMLLRAFWNDALGPLEPDLEPCLDSMKLGLQRVLQGRYEDALRLYPCGLTYLFAGQNSYFVGNCSLALERLQSAYQYAATEGRLHIMLNSRILMGNCYSNQRNVVNMLEHYRVAQRLARAIGDNTTIQTLQYNIAATRLEAGNYSEAYDSLNSLDDPDALSLHKLAICCEKLGKIDEAFYALDRAESLYSDASLRSGSVKAMCDIVRYRLEHEDHLNDPIYGKMLLEFFDLCCKTLPSGYASFHLPWVLEWYAASRKYKQAYELLLDFPH